MPNTGTSNFTANETARNIVPSPPIAITKSIFVIFSKLKF